MIDVTISMRVMLLAAAILVCASPAAAQSGYSIVAAVFRTPFHDDAPEEDPGGVRAAVATARGLGIEGRWAHTDASDYWSVGLIQMLPGVRGAKTIQPFGSIGAGRLTRAGEGIPYISLAGGVVTFIGHFGLGVDFRYVRGTERLASETVRERHVSFELLWRF